MEVEVKSPCNFCGRKTSQKSLYEFGKAEICLNCKSANSSNYIPKGRVIKAREGEQPQETRPLKRNTLSDFYQRKNKKPVVVQ